MKTRGFTLIELMIVIAIIGIFFLLLVGGIFMSCSNNKDYAEQEAWRFAKELKMDVNAISCAKIDSDNDGYVSCTFMIKDGDRFQPQAFECSRRVSLNEGCRTPKMKAFR